MSSGNDATLINVKTSGLKMDLVLRKRKVTGLSIDYQKLTKDAELQKWVAMLYSMLSGSTPASDAAIPLMIGGVTARPPAQPKSPKRYEDDTHQVQETNDFDEIVLQAIDTSLNILGQDGKQVLLNLMENRHGFRLQDVPQHPKAFIQLLDGLLGETAYTLEKEIINEIRKVAPVQGKTLYQVVRSLKGLAIKKALKQAMDHTIKQEQIIKQALDSVQEPMEAVIIPIPEKEPVIQQTSAESLDYSLPKSYNYNLKLNPQQRKSP